VSTRGFTLIEVLVALGMFVLAVGGLALALDRAFAASNLLRQEDEIRQQVASLIDQAMILPIDALAEGRETGPDALGVTYRTSAAPIDDLVNRNEEALGGLWRVTVLASWEQAGGNQEWREEFLRYQP